MLEIRVIGELTIVLDGRRVELPRGRRESALLGWLAIHPGSHARSRVASVFWPDVLDESARMSLRTALSSLRKALGPRAERYLVSDRASVGLAASPLVWVDALEFKRLFAAGELDEALELAKGELLPSQDEDWVLAARDEHARALGEIHERLALRAASAGDLKTAVEHTRSQVALEPLSEDVLRRLIERLTAVGDHAAASAEYERFARRLRDELRLVPSAATRELADRLRAPPALRRKQIPAALARGNAGAFVGRMLELDRLGAALHRALAGEPRVALIGGDPGIGKTRLCQELAVRAHRDGANVLYGRCEEDALLPYQPFVEAFAAIAESAASPHLAPLCPGVVPASSAGSSDPAGERYLMFEAAAELLAHLSEGAPVLLVLDDLHWADHATLRLLQHILRPRRLARLLVVGTYREGEVPTGPLASALAELQREGVVDRTALRALDSQSVRDLVHAWSGHDVAPEFAAALRAHTDGNPFFIEEVLRELAESGTPPTVAGDTALGVPDGVRDVVAGRVARLPSDARVLLATASVLGRAFDLLTVRRLLGLDEEALLAALDDALRARLIRDTGENYEFAHALVQQTLYESLGRARRERLHKRAAEALAAAQGEPAIGRIAAHYRAAGTAVEVPTVVATSFQAGLAAAAAFAWEDAAAHWEAALARMDDSIESARLHERVGDLRFGTLTDIEGSLAHFDAALRTYERLGDRARAGRAHSRIGRTLSTHPHHQDLPRAFSHFDAAEQALAAEPDAPATALMLGGIAYACTGALELDRALDASRRAMAIADSRGDESLWASAAANASTIHNIRAEYGTALELAARARGIGEEVGNAFARWHATTLPAANRAVLGDHRLARELMEREISHADLQDAPFRHGPAMSVLGTALSVAGDLAAARECARHAYVGGVLADARRTLDLIDGNWEQLDAIVTAQIDDARAAGEMFTVVEGSIVVGRARALLGDDRGARAAYDEAEEIAAARGATALAALVQPERARVQLVTGELDAARASIVRCRALMNLEEPWCAHPARVDIADASVAAAMGDLARAEYLFRRGLDLLESFALPFDQADAHVEWGRALTRAGREAEAADHFNAALKLYTRHGAGERWRERARALRLEPRR